MFRMAEIAKLEVVGLLGSDQNALGSDVPVTDLPAVEELNHVQALPRQGLNGAFFQLFRQRIVQQIRKAAIRSKIHDQEGSVGHTDVVNESDNVWLLNQYFFTGRLDAEHTCRTLRSSLISWSASCCVAIPTSCLCSIAG